MSAGHAAWALALLKRAEADPTGASVARVGAEDENLSWARAWADETRAPGLADELRRSTAQFWSVRRQALFDIWAEHYDPAGTAEFPHGDYERVLDLVAELAAHRRPNRILELGVGTANLTLRLRRHLPDAVIVGLDFSSAMLDCASGVVPDVVLVEHDLRAPLPDIGGRCEVAVAAYVLHEFDDDAKLRLLTTLITENVSQGGACIVGDIGFENARAQAVARRAHAERWDPYEHYFVVDEVARAASRHGLAIDMEAVGPHSIVLVVRQEDPSIGTESLRP